MLYISVINLLFSPVKSPTLLMTTDYFSFVILNFNNVFPVKRAFSTKI